MSAPYAPVIPDHDQPVASDDDITAINLDQLLEESGTFQYTNPEIYPIGSIVPMVIVAILILMGLRIVTNLARGKSLFSGFDRGRPRPLHDDLFRGDEEGPLGMFRRDPLSRDP